MDEIKKEEKRKLLQTTVAYRTYRERKRKEEVAQFMLMSYWKFFFSLSLFFSFYEYKDLLNESKTLALPHMSKDYD